MNMPPQQPIQPDQPMPSQSGAMPVPEMFQQPPIDQITEQHVYGAINGILSFMEQIIQSTTPLYQKVNFVSQLGATIASINHVLPSESLRYQLTQLQQQQQIDQAKAANEIQIKQTEAQQKLAIQQQQAQLQAQAHQQKQQLSNVQVVQKIDQASQSHQQQLQANEQKQQADAINHFQSLRQQEEAHRQKLISDKQKAQHQAQQTKNKPSK